MNIRNVIKAHIVQEGTTMSEVVRDAGGRVGPVRVVCKEQNGANRNEEV